jgi:hypothetical protein
MILVLEIFRANIFLPTHSETNCSSLLSVSVISVAVVADVLSVESSIDTLALLSQWHVVSKKERGINSSPVPDSN